MMTVSLSPPISPIPLFVCTPVSQHLPYEQVVSSHLVALLHTVPPYPYCPVLPYLRPPQCLMPPLPRYLSHPPVPRCNAIKFSLGLCSACISGKLAVRILVTVYAIHVTKLVIISTIIYKLKQIQCSQQIHNTYPD